MPKTKKGDTTKTASKKPSKEVTKLTKKIEALEAQLADNEPQLNAYKEESLRHMAELENFRRRKQQEVDTFKKYAAESVITAFLPVLDNFLLATEHAEKHDQDSEEIIKGFVLIKKQLDSVLEKLNVTVIDALDQPFDPNLHQAISQEAKKGVKPDTVIQEMQKGYKLFDRVIRPAMVVVSQ